MALAPAIKPEWLPAGWLIERVAGFNVYCITRPNGGGMVTINPQQRIANPGYCNPIKGLVPPELDREYAGARWLERLVRDACAWLDKVMS